MMASRQEARRIEAMAVLSTSRTAVEVYRAALAASKRGIRLGAIVNAAFSAGYRHGYAAALQDGGE